MRLTLSQTEIKTADRTLETVTTLDSTEITAPFQMQYLDFRGLAIDELTSTISNVLLGTTLKFDMAAPNTITAAAKPKYF